MKLAAIIFDLDDTLIPEEPHVSQAYQSACALAHRRLGVDPAALESAVRDAASQNLCESPWARTCDDLGVAAWETMSADCQNDNPLSPAFHSWMAEHRLNSWRAGLRRHDVVDDAMTAELSERFCRERLEQPYHPYPGAHSMLRDLSAAFPLAIITNGLEILQLAKLRNAGLLDFFQTLVISEAVGIGKPDVKIFRHALNVLGVAPAEAVMVGNSLKRDIAGAAAAGIPSIWVNADNEPLPPILQPVRQIRAIAELPAALGSIE